MEIHARDRTCFGLDHQEPEGISRYLNEHFRQNKADNRNEFAYNSIIGQAEYTCPNRYFMDRIFMD